MCVRVVRLLCVDYCPPTPLCFCLRGVTRGVFVVWFSRGMIVFWFPPYGVIAFTQDGTIFSWSESFFTIRNDSHGTIGFPKTGWLSHMARFGLTQDGMVFRMALLFPLQDGIGSRWRDLFSQYCTGRFVPFEAIAVSHNAVVVP